MSEECPLDRLVYDCLSTSEEGGLSDEEKNVLRTQKGNLERIEEEISTKLNDSILWEAYDTTKSEIELLKLKSAFRRGLYDGFKIGDFFTNFNKNIN